MLDRNSQIELESIKTELQSIIDELRNISYGVNRDFDGIGSELCSANIQKAANHYVDVKNRLSRIDTTIVTDEFRVKQESAKVAPPTTQTSNNSSSKTSTTSPTVKSNTTKTSTNTGSKSKKNNDILDDAVDGIKGAFSWLFK